MTTRFTSSVQHGDIVDVVGLDDALKGWIYFEDGRVFDSHQRLEPDQNTLRLWAKCTGSQPQAYRVSASLKQGTVIGSRCTCTAVDSCEHVAALLYTWIHAPEDFETVDDWRIEMTSWSKEQLLEVIFAVGGQSAEMQALLQDKAEEVQDIESGFLRDAAGAIRFAPLILVPELADELAGEGYEEQAAELVIGRLDGRRSGILVDWLIEHYEVVSDYSNALIWARRRLDDVPRAAYYATVWSIAQQLGVWSELRVTLLARLMRANFSEYIKALLLEGRSVESLDAYGEGLQQGEKLPDATQLRLAEIAESIDPQRALMLYSELIGGLIERRTREYYRMAANILARIESLYVRMGKQNEWQAMFGEFVATYPRRPQLIQELERANLLGIG